ncbi:MAG: ABC transporter permease [Chloroflexi bacterium]|nr:ABC transporter permease [Chloroflexota bacterium]
MQQGPLTTVRPVPALQHRPARPWYGQLLIRLVREKPLGTVGAVLVLVMVVLALGAEVIAPYDYQGTFRDYLMVPPSSRFLFGTDNIGRDVFSRVVYGARVSITVGLGVVILGVGAATVLGIITGYFGGKVDILLQRLVDTWMAFPGLLILISLIAVVGPGLWNVILVLAVGQAFRGSRVMRSSTLSVKENVYIEAARVMGATDLRIMWRHVLPNIMAPIIILSTLEFGSVILVESSLSFLGFGVPPPYPSWGGMLSGVGRQYMHQAPWMVVWPGLAISAGVFGFNMLGDALRDLLDPRLRGSGAGRY